MNKIFILIISVATVSAGLLSGCSTDETVLPESSMAPEEIISRINAQPEAIQSFTAAGSIYVETPQMSQSAGFDLAVKKPDSVLITISGPFGITLGQGLFTKATFIAYSALNNTVYRGNSGAGIQSLPFFAGIDIDVMIDAMSGVRRFDNSFGEPDSFTVGTRSYIFTFRGNPRTTKFFVDARSYLITRVITYRDDNTVLWEERYTYSAAAAGQWQPSSVKVTVPDRSMSMELIYDEILLNGALPEFSIGYPNDASRITID
ncbi:MAG: DUF4292 domain-containing protein [Bacteroidota bacterium]